VFATLGYYIIISTFLVLIVLVFGGERQREGYILRGGHDNCLSTSDSEGFGEV